MHNTFAADTLSPTLITAVISAVVMSLVVGIFKGIEMLRAKWAAEAKADMQTVAHWTDVTGEIRPITSQECAGRHAVLTEEFRKNSAKVEKLDSTLTDVKLALQGLAGEMGSGVELRIRSYADDIAASHVSQHEKAMHPRSSSSRSTGEILKPGR